MPEKRFRLTGWQLVGNLLAGITCIVLLGLRPANYERTAPNKQATLRVTQPNALYRWFDSRVHHGAPVWSKLSITLVQRGLPNEVLRTEPIRYTETREPYIAWSAEGQHVVVTLRGYSERLQQQQETVFEILPFDLTSDHPRYVNPFLNTTVPWMRAAVEEDAKLPDYSMIARETLSLFPRSGIAASDMTRIVMYQVVPLTESGDLSTAESINAAGAVVGMRYDGRARHAYVWRDGKRTDLISPSLTGDGGASFIGDRGNILGWTSDAAASGASIITWFPETGNTGKALLFSESQTVLRPTQQDDAGNIVGSSTALRGKKAVRQGFIIAAGSRELHKTEDSAVALTRQGTLYYSMRAADTLKYVATRQVASIEPIVLAPLPENARRVAQLTCNDLGTIALTFSRNEKERTQWQYNEAADDYWTEIWKIQKSAGTATVTSRQLLVSPPSMPNATVAAINNRGVAVGSGYSHLTTNGTPSLYRSSALLWTKPDTVIDLNQRIPEDSGWVLVTAKGINDAGYIVGEGMFQGTRCGYLLKPITTK